MKQRVRIYHVQITKPAHRKNFQLRLPQNACSITGVEVTHTAIPAKTGGGSSGGTPTQIGGVSIGGGGTTVGGSSQTGTLLLQDTNYVGQLVLTSNSSSNHFYASDLYHELNVNRQLQITGVPDLSISQGRPWVEGTQSQPFVLCEGIESTLLHGFYEDGAHPAQPDFTPYFINIYLYLNYH